MGKVTVNQNKLHVADEMCPSEEQGTGTLIYTKKSYAGEKETAPAAGEEKDAAADTQPRP